MAEFGFINEGDTDWLPAAAAVDMDTYPAVVIPPDMKYTYQYRPDYFDLYKDGQSVQNKIGLHDYFNRAQFEAIRYLTGPLDLLDLDATGWDSALIQKYKRYRLESAFIHVVDVPPKCDPGLQRIGDTAGSLQN